MIEKRVTATRPVGFLVAISVLILFTVLLATGGLYFYKGVLTKKITYQQDQLKQNKTRLESTKIAELQTLDKRLKAASEILSNHVAISPIFQALSEVTMKTVRYTKFSYDTAAADKNSKDAKVNIKMSGVAVGYRSVALQSDLFAKNKNLINPIFSNLTLDNSGNVLFDLEFSVDPSFVNYKQIVGTKS